MNNISKIRQSNFGAGRTRQNFCLLYKKTVNECCRRVRPASFALTKFCPTLPNFKEAATKYRRAPWARQFFVRRFYRTFFVCLESQNPLALSKPRAEAIECISFHYSKLTIILRLKWISNHDSAVRGSTQYGRNQRRRRNAFLWFICSIINKTFIVRRLILQ